MSFWPFRQILAPLSTRQHELPSKISNNLFCFRLVILAGGYTVELLEEGREGGGAGESAGVGDLRDVHLAVGQQFGGLLQAHLADEVVRRLARQVFHLAVQVDTAETHFAGY